MALFEVGLAGERRWWWLGKGIERKMNRNINVTKNDSQIRYKVTINFQLGRIFPYSRLVLYFARVIAAVLLIQ